MFNKKIFDHSMKITSQHLAKHEPGRILMAALCLGVCSILPGVAGAAVIFGNIGLDYGSRWDMAPRTINGLERSLDGGLRYSVQGGSYQAFRDMFIWQGGIAPSVSAFQTVVENAFNAWTVVDPVSGLGTRLSFTPDFATPVAGPSSTGYVNTAGAEIDLLAYTDATLWDPGDTFQQAETYFDTTPTPTTVTLTSGTTGYVGFAIAGADIKFNSNPEAQYSLDFFQLLLTHEIGHALGLGDVDVDGNFGRFIDDNYNGANSATALATLTNSWAGLVNPFNPAASPLALYQVANADPGVDTSGVDILMETDIPRSLTGNLTPLGNDDYGGRQFLYPVVVPVPAAVWLFGSGLLGLVGIARRKKRKV